MRPDRGELSHGHRILLHEPLFDGWWLGFSHDHAMLPPCESVLQEAVWVAYRSFPWEVGLGD